ncbi:MAG: DUF3427 domain-containing protein [Acholeplasmatales bacterium]|jgi:superfamily II DNA or RNA helicase|nr:DUF3427 domain-containing protein [Acholeplasmatales bacterium]
MNDLFLTNYTEMNFLTKIKSSLKNCTSFLFSVSFIKKAGLVLLEREMKEALDRGVDGKIITSTYQNFTDINSLRTFLKWMEEYSNFECHLDYECFGDDGFHSKGYLFEFENSVEFIVGSTNITRFALLKNVEWNVSLSYDENFSSYDSAEKEFNKLWNKTKLLNKELIKEYQMRLDYAINKWDMDYLDFTNETIRPNAMQRKALKEIRRYRDLGVTRALIVSATGSGKTYLGAFDARNFDAKTLLFVVHRDTILNEAMKTFARVFGATRTYGIYTGKKQDLDCDFLFSTNTMMARHCYEFDKNAFQYICMDEAHHATASSYKTIMNYFKAEFILGLTATPERMDEEDVFALFEQNVPYELRLRDAICNDLVVPFHYYGIRDDLIEYGDKNISKVIKSISANTNVEFICNQIDKYQKLEEISGKLKCIAFCTNIAHAEIMAEEFNNFGYSSISLTGANNLGQRVKSFNDLQDDNNELEIICTVDILNEGVDIPAINMVLFLRPTESSTIFLQQLGRGLRKYKDKKYVIVLDFIGNNYDRSIQIAMALGTLGKSTIIEKAYLKEMVNSNFKELNIPGVSVYIDELSRQEIIHHIDNQNFNRKGFLKKDYQNFKKFLNIDKYPTHMDFLNCEYAPDLMRFMKSTIASKKNISYYNFLIKMEEENLPIFDEEQITFINGASDLLPLVRVDEYLIINQLMQYQEINLNDLIGYNSKVNINTLKHAHKMLSNKEILSNDKLNVNISTELEKYLMDLLQYGLSRYDIEFGEYEGDFKLYGNYYKDQIMRIQLEEALMFMKGTKFNQNGETIVFVGLKKDKDKLEKTNYKDKFISSSTFQWESENNTTETSATGIKLLNTKKVHLFIRKMDDEDGITLPFTYFGTGQFTNMRKSYVDTLDYKGNPYKASTLLFDIKLDNIVPDEYRFDFEIPEDIE